MNIRPLVPSDEKELREIHARYFSKEFTFADFSRGFIASCVVESESGEIISGGGIRSLAEVVLITNKDFSVRDRREALYKILEASLFTGSRLGFEGLHAFIQDETWMKHLKRVGFKETKGKSLVISI